MIHKSKTCRQFSIVIICILIVLTSAACSRNSLVDNSSISDNVERAEYKDRLGTSQGELPKDSSMYGIFVSSEKQNDDTGTVLQLDDSQDTIYVTVTHRGRKENLNLTLFLDFKQVAFKVGDGESSLEYCFEIEDDEEVKIPITLNNVDNDLYRHKLFVNIVTDYDKFTTNQDGVFEAAGVRHVSDLVFGENNDVPLDIIKKDFAEPDKIFSCQAASLVLNTDFENASINEKNLPKVPDKEYTVKANEETELMYNITGTEETNSAVLLLTVDYKQVPINQNDYLTFKLNGKETLNGKISFVAPEKPGLYEVIGYTMFNPYEPTTKTAIHFLRPSFRFTLNVI